ncbi:TlpA disulfide reductase family protein [Zunongwangia sp. HRR-M8]|uniref:TlpA disulfide reductase family protein n=1 Tax=Zunongwangia sp. HRR-M8 TaxID=3015170 RepID=UPI0022DDEF8A|nr:TlpA disulfide reductase family protein [Zunongwangia sp. HRR-M8]WBL23833.1 TlpA disulfide reductase family protein [Zunongwangia sp. HRR-M8]
MKTTNFILLFLIPIISQSQNFNLKGEFSGENTDQIVLFYTGINGKVVTDTLQVKNNKFQTSGKIKGIQRISVVGNMKTNRMEDPNLGHFFMEPGNIKVNLKENQFKDLIVIGSNSQNEFEKVQSKTKSIRLELDSIAKNRSQNSTNLLTSGNYKIQKIELNYAIKNPESSISPYFLHHYQRRIPLDSVKTIFNSFSDQNKNSIYGKIIYDLIDKKIPQVNDNAPDFKAKDIKGNEISLANYRGKYLLIDFWADWCKPCTAKFPEVKSLIEKYKAQDLKVLFVSFDKTEEEWRKSVEKRNIKNWDNTYIGLRNLSNKESISYKYDIQPIPAYILINKNGKIVGRYDGTSKTNKGFDDLKNKLQELMKR